MHNKCTLTSFKCMHFQFVFIILSWCKIQRVFHWFKIPYIKYYDENLYYDYRSSANGKVIDKYYCGTALLESPFFLVAHLSSYLLDYELDGYSKLYPISINISAIFYLIIGLIFLNATLDTYQIKNWQKSITFFAAVFGTNLFYYTVGEPGMSHVFSFALVSLFYYYSRTYFLRNNKHHLLKLFLLLNSFSLYKLEQLQIHLQLQYFLLHNLF